jgi:protein TonB
MRIARLVLLSALVAVAIPVLAQEADEVLYGGVDGVTMPELKLKSQIEPYYPATARLNHAEATVTLATTINAKGKVVGLEVVQSDQPDLGFEQAAMDAVKQWRFQPGVRDGEAVATINYISLHIVEPRGRSVFGSSTLAGAGFLNTAAVLPQLGRDSMLKLPLDQMATFQHHQDRGGVAEKPPSCGDRSKCTYNRNSMNNGRTFADVSRGGD